MPQPSETPREFPTQRLDEKPIVVMHRHWIVLAKFWVETLALIIIPPIFIAVMYGFEIFTYEPDGALFISIVLGTSLFYLFVARHVFHDWIDYYLDIWAITDQRIVSIELAGLFDRVISELPIEKVQDVTSEIKGFMATLLNYGNVYIQTAGEKERFVFEEIAMPQKIQQAVLRVQTQYMEKTKKQSDKDLAKAMVEQGVAIPSTSAPSLTPAAPAPASLPATPTSPVPPPTTPTTTPQP